MSKSKNTKEVEKLFPFKGNVSSWIGSWTRVGGVKRDSIETIDGVLKGTMDSTIMSY